MSWFNFSAKTSAAKSAPAVAAPAPMPVVAQPVVQAPAPEPVATPAPHEKEVTVLEQLVAGRDRLITTDVEVGVEADEAQAAAEALAALTQEVILANNALEKTYERAAKAQAAKERAEAQALAVLSMIGKGVIRTQAEVDAENAAKAKELEIAQVKAAAQAALAKEQAEAEAAAKELEQAQAAAEAQAEAEYKALEAEEVAKAAAELVRKVTFGLI